MHFRLSQNTLPDEVEEVAWYVLFKTLTEIQELLKVIIHCAYAFIPSLGIAEKTPSLMGPVDSVLAY